MKPIRSLLALDDDEGRVRRFCEEFINGDGDCFTSNLFVFEFIFR